MRGMELIQKAVVEDGGFALVWLSVPTVGKRVFLRIVSAIPTVMRGMTPSSTTVKKAAYGRSKSPAFAGTKTAANRSPSPNLRKPLPKPSPREDTEKLKPTIKLKVDDGEIAVLPFIICLF